MYYIGIDLGGTNIACGLVDSDAKLIYKKNTRTEVEKGADAIIAAMAGLARETVGGAGVSESDIIGVGIGSPGTVDSARGMVAYSCNLPFLNTPVVECFRTYWDIPVFIGNDADCAALGEAYSETAKQYDDIIMITLGTGLGGGIIIGKKIYNGFTGGGGEVGHIGIVYDGRLCACGRKGCWETYSSATGLAATTREAMMEDKDKTSAMWSIAGSLEGAGGRTAFDAMRQGDAKGAEVVDKYIKYLAYGVTNMINIFQPELFLIGGGVSKEGDALLAPLRREVKKDVYVKDYDVERIAAATLGNDAGIIGAAMLCV